MVQLAAGDIRTREVLDWEGVHLFHFARSSASQKARVFLNLKGIEWTSHEVDLSHNENFTPFYLGINPRGLVPTLVLDGAVHIESNDILTVLEQRFPEPRLIPARMEAEVAALLRHEDDLHLDLRTITFRYTQARGRAPKSPAALTDYRAGGSGMVGGKVDSHRSREIEFWERIARDGITDEAIRVSAGRFRTAFEQFDARLAQQRYLYGDTLTVLDIAWFIYANRLYLLCGYPLERLHPRLTAWFEQLRAIPAFEREIEMPAAVRAAIDENHRQQEERGDTLVDVAGY